MTVTANRYLQGNYAPVTEEVTVTELPITGHLPEELNGRYLRNGPNPVVAPDPALYHWFSGDGMVHGIRLRDGRAEWYRNRWVRSGPVAAALGESPPAGDVHAGMDFGANTNVIGHAGRTLALVEAGARPVELTYELDTVTRTDLDGTLPNGFSAHPKRDPATGELHVSAYFWALPYLQYIVVGTDGTARVVEPIEVKGSPMVHDMSITETNAVFYDLPVTFSMDMVAAGALLPYRWDDDYGARIGIMPFGGGSADVQWIDIEPCYVFHPLNAYDDGDTVVIDVVRWPRMFDTHLLGPNEGVPTLWRWTFDGAGGKLREELIDDRPQEFPRVDERVVGRRHRYGWTAGATHGDGGVDFDGNCIIKHDLVARTSQAHELGRASAAGEAVFVPRAADAGEDDGYVMALVYRADTDRSDLVVLDGGDMTAEPVAVVHLPQRVPYGFHGNWVPDTD